MGSSVILPSPGQPNKGADPGFKSATTPNIVTFGFDKVGPPSSLYVQRDDNLVITLRNSFAGLSVSVSARLLMPVGQKAGQPDAPVSPGAPSTFTAAGWLNIMQQLVNPRSDRVPQDFTFSLPECYLLSISVTASGGGLLRLGQCFASVGITRLGPAPTRYMELISGQLADGRDIGWPGVSQLTAAEGPGFLHSVAVANPAAGADWIFTVPANTRMRIVCWQATLTASAAAANRQVQAQVGDGANNYWTSGASANVTAGQTAFFSATGANAPTSVITADQTLVLPPQLILPSGHQLKTATGAIQAGDQWSNILLMAEEWVGM